MLELLIDEKACRGCQLCLDVCPTECFSFNEESKKSEVVRAANCIACLSCIYVCPSQAMSHKNIHEVKNFYRNIEFSQKISRFL